MKIELTIESMRGGWLIIATRSDDGTIGRTEEAMGATWKAVSRRCAELVLLLKSDVVAEANKS